jgi:uncharacterized membrane protein YhhN
MTPVVFSVVCLVALALLLIGEYRRDARVRYRTKPAASAAFLAVALARALGSSAHPGEEFLLCGLVLGALGDVLLMFDTKASFLSGLVAFLVGHAAYVIAFAYAAPPSAWVAFPTVIVLVWAALVLRSLWPRLGDMRIPVVIYVATICVMVAAGLAVYRAGAPDGPVIAIGAASFAVSDVAVARDRFVADTFANKAWGLPLYYVAQLLLAWTIGV